MRLLIGIGIGAAALTALVAGTAEAGCAGSYPLTNWSIGYDTAGGFDMTGTPYEGKGSPAPTIRFWAFGHFAKANSGTHPQHNKAVPWLSQVLIDYAEQVTPEIRKNLEPAHKNVFSLDQANWGAGKVVGCFQSLDGVNRSVVEIAFTDEAAEGTAKHRGFYAVSSVSAPHSRFNFDLVRGGRGKNKNIVPVEPVPVPGVSAKATANEKDDGYLDVEVTLGAVRSYSEGGVDQPVKLIQGYRVLFASGAEPTSSLPAGYQTARDPKKPSKTLDLIPLGSGDVTATVAVPKASDGRVYLVTQLVYNDASDLTSRVVSGHSRGIAPDGGLSGGGRSRNATRERRR